MEGTGRMREYTLPRGSLNRYRIHQVLSAIMDGKHGIFAIDGDHVRFRCDRNLPLPHDEIGPFPAGYTCGFALTVSCYVKNRGRRAYLSPDDETSRVTWLNKKSAQHGFRVLDLVVASNVENIKTFSMDVTTFSGHLEVSDAALFQSALQMGISGGGSRAFGFGYLAISRS